MGHVVVILEIEVLYLEQCAESENWPIRRFLAEFTGFYLAQKSSENNVKCVSDFVSVHHWANFHTWPCHLLSHGFSINNKIGDKYQN